MCICCSTAMAREDPTARPAYANCKLRHRYTFRGTVQGVGFRPTVFRCASQLGLSGYVQNRRSEVIAEVEGTPDVLDRFPQLLSDLLPGAARIERTEVAKLAPLGGSSFRIEHSDSSAYTFPPIPPDLALCEPCRGELLDPADRRYLYPFITCTQCGPRYSIVENTPFDRETTAMVDFPPCPECLAEYGDPEDRRFHSQTNSCPICGPRLRLVTAAGQPVAGDAIGRTIQALNQGAVVAVQGIGGFHLAANPEQESAVSRLRRDKERARKPFALMVGSFDVARTLCDLDSQAQQILTSIESPILIVPARESIPPYLERVSDVGTLGLMLPYTPLHYLLFHHPEARIRYAQLIMTSANQRGEPIVTAPCEARHKLAHIADLFLFHNRRIVFRSDDSVVRRALPKRVTFRRSRGYVPRLISLRESVAHTTLGVGSDLKNAPALALKDELYLSPFVGDLEDPTTYDDFKRQIERILTLYDLQPEIVRHDLHPRYFSSRWAIASAYPKRTAVQHHQAHILSVMAEHGLDEALGLAFDGTGYGSDGTIWGGEFLHVRRHSFERLGCFKPFLLPGGEKAIEHPWRIAVALLATHLSRQELSAMTSTRGRISPADLDLLLQMLDAKLNVAVTSSLGRLFDAASALLDLVDRVSYEGEGPIKLEDEAARAYRATPTTGDMQQLAELVDFRQDCRPFQVGFERVLLYLARRHLPRAQLALLFHQAVAFASLLGAARMRDQASIATIALSGGVFHNALLRQLLIPELKEHGFEVYVNEQVPAGDGGIAVGQVYFSEE